MKYPRQIEYWLWTGLFMIFIQVMIGGITRLTDSGLSITEWELIQGTLPPLSEKAWQEAFNAYKQEAKAQYERLHADMSLDDFKWIYFWEWFHRVWARLMGVVFIIPMIYFLWKRWVDRRLLLHLFWIFMFAGAAGIMGWIMVASGLNNDQRTWVSAYKLIAHLCIAGLTLSMIYWTILYVTTPSDYRKYNPNLARLSTWFIILLAIQILWGGLMAGMRAGLLHPHWPIFVEGSNLWNAVAEGSIAAQDWINYEPSVFVKAIVQLCHRALAYVLLALGLWFVWRILSYYRDFRMRNMAYALVLALTIQVLLGIFTIVYCVGSVPITLAVMHQMVAFVLLLIALRIRYYTNRRPLAPVPSHILL